MNNKETASTIQRLLDNISAAREIVRRATPVDAYGIVEAFVVNEINAWKDGNKQLGWVLHPINGKIFANSGLELSGSVELVAFEDLGEVNEQGYIGAVPMVGDLAIVTRSKRDLRRESIQLLRGKEE